MALVPRGWLPWWEWGGEFEIGTTRWLWTLPRAWHTIRHRAQVGENSRRILKQASTTWETSLAKKRAWKNILLKLKDPNCNIVIQFGVRRTNPKSQPQEYRDVNLKTQVISNCLEEKVNSWNVWNQFSRYTASFNVAKLAFEKTSWHMQFCRQSLFDQMIKEIVQGVLKKSNFNCTDI